MFQSHNTRVVAFALGVAMIASSPALSATLRISHNLGVGGRESLDPASASRFSEAIEMIYDRLVVPSKAGLPEASLASSWTNSADLKEWTFKLREGVKFHDGSQFSAEDAAFSLKRILNPKLASPAKSVLDIIESVEAVDATTLRVKLKQAHADFPMLLLDYRIRMISSKSVNGDLDAVADGGNGTGPFKIQTLDAKGTTVVIANNDYWGGKPGVDEIEIIAIPDQDARNQALLAGQIDMANVIPSEIGLFNTNKQFVVQQVPAGNFNPLVMRTDVAPFNDVRVRKALKMLVDREALRKLVIGEANGSLGCDEPVWPGDAYYNANIRCTTDIEGAKKLLSEAGYPNGLSIDLYTSSVMPIMVPLAEAYQAQAAKAGVKVNVKVVPADGYWSKVWMQPNRPFVIGNWGQRPADQILNEVFRAGAKWNETAWNRPDFEALLDQARSNGSLEGRKELYGKAQAMLSEEGGQIVPFFQNQMRVYSAALSNVAEMPDINLPWNKITKK